MIGELLPHGKCKHVVVREIFSIIISWMRKRSYSCSIDYLGWHSMSFTLSDIMYVKLFKGQSWRLALISNMSASGMCKVTKVLPKVFFRAPVSPSSSHTRVLFWV